MMIQENFLFHRRQREVETFLEECYESRLKGALASLAFAPLNNEMLRIIERRTLEGNFNDIDFMGLLS